jgi:septal ring factor EnvC (AmiA/AmiB activator)
MSDEVHPKKCRCEKCKRYRQRTRMKESYPERHRQLKHRRGQDSEVDDVIQSIPENMTEREARARGLIE